MAEREKLDIRKVSKYPCIQVSRKLDARASPTYFLHLRTPSYYRPDPGSIGGSPFLNVHECKLVRNATSAKIAIIVKIWKNIETFKTIIIINSFSVKFGTKNITFQENALFKPRKLAIYI